MPSRFFIRALEIVEKQLGTDHPNVAGILNNLALVHQAQGKHTDAEPLFSRALEIYETQFKPTTPNLANA